MQNNNTSVIYTQHSPYPDPSHRLYSHFLSDLLGVSTNLRHIGSLAHEGGGNVVNVVLNTPP